MGWNEFVTVTLLVTLLTKNSIAVSDDVQEIPEDIFEVNSIIGNDTDSDDMCKVILEKFSDSSSKFTQCATQFARPINMCRFCKEHFINVKNLYDALEHSEQEGINCKDLLTSQDKVEIIQETYDFIAGKGGLWEKGYCSYCYTSPLTETSNLTDDAVTFFALYGSVQDCFAAHPENQSLSLGVTKSEACKECAIDYWKLKSFYRDQFLEDESPDATGVCFDILDAMNSTQHRWGNGFYHCGRTLQGNLPLISAVLLVLLTPISLYLGVRFAPGTRRAQERVITNHSFRQTLIQAQESVEQLNRSGVVQENVVTNDS